MTRTRTSAVVCCAAAGTAPHPASVSASAADRKRRCAYTELLTMQGLRPNDTEREYSRTCMSGARTLGTQNVVPNSAERSFTRRHEHFWALRVARLSASATTRGCFSIQPTLSDRGLPDCEGRW